MGKPSWIEEFKSFIMRGNVIDLAVGVVIGGAFTALVNGVVESIINPIITLITGNTDFSDVTIGMFPIGNLISAIVNFLLISFVVFWMIRMINKAMALTKKKEEEAEEEAPPEPSNEEKLLTEIRDLLKNK